MSQSYEDYTIPFTPQGEIFHKAPPFPGATHPAATWWDVAFGRDYDFEGNLLPEEVRKANNDRHNAEVSDGSEAGKRARAKFEKRVNESETYLKLLNDDHPDAGSTEWYDESEFAREVSERRGKRHTLRSEAKNLLDPNHKPDADPVVRAAQAENPQPAQTTTLADQVDTPPATGGGPAQQASQAGQGAGAPQAGQGAGAPQAGQGAGAPQAGQGAGAGNANPPNPNPPVNPATPQTPAPAASKFKKPYLESLTEIFEQGTGGRGSTSTGLEGHLPFFGEKSFFTGPEGVVKSTIRETGARLKGDPELGKGTGWHQIGARGAVRIPHRLAVMDQVLTGGRNVAGLAGLMGDNWGEAGGHIGNALWTTGRLNPLSPFFGSNYGEEENFMDAAGIAPIGHKALTLFGLLGDSSMADKPESLGPNKLSPQEKTARRDAISSVFQGMPISRETGINALNWADLSSKNNQEYQALGTALGYDPDKMTAGSPDLKSFQQSFTQNMADIQKLAEKDPTAAMAKIRGLTGKARQMSEEAARARGETAEKTEDGEVFYFPEPVKRKEKVDGFDKDVEYYMALWHPKGTTRTRRLMIRAGSDPANPKPGSMNWD